MKISDLNNKRYSAPLSKEIDDFTRRRIQIITEMVGFSDSLLDVGCWDGYISKLLLNSGKVKRAVGVDNSKAAIKLAKKNGIIAKYINSCDSKLPFGNAQFDCIIAGELVEHLYDVNGFFREARRTLKKGGSLIISTPNLASLGSRIGLFLGIKPWMIENEFNKESAGHLRYFTFSELDRMLKKHSFIPERKETEALNYKQRKILNRHVLRVFRVFGRTIIVKYIKT